MIRLPESRFPVPRRFSLWALRAVLLTITLCGSARAESLAPFVAPSQWMSRLAEQTLVPGYAQLSTRVEALTVAVETLCTTPGDAARSTAHEQWRAAALQLRRLSALPVGPVLDSRVLRYVDFWPTRPAQIESAIVGRAAENVAQCPVANGGVGRLQQPGERVAV